MRFLPFVALLFVATVLADGIPSPGPDETAALQRAVDALPPGGTLLLEARPYRFQGVRITRSLTVRGQGPERTACTRQEAQPFFIITGRSVEVVLQGFALEGGGRDAAGVEAVEVRSLRLRDVRVAHCGVPPPGSLPDDGHGRPVDGVYAKDVERAEAVRCRFEANARDGFIGIPVRHLRFEGNVCRGNGRMGCTSDVDPEKRAGGPLEAVYLDNVVEDCGTGGLHVESDAGLAPVEARFERNRVTGCGGRDWGYAWGITLGANAWGLVKDNTIAGTGKGSLLEAYRNGIHVARPAGDVRIEGNRILDSGRCGISVAESRAAVTLVGNTIEGAGSDGISAYMVRKLHVEDCAVSGAAGSGLGIRLCPGPFVARCRFRDNSVGAPGRYPAVRLESTGRARLVGNDFGGPPQAYGVEASPRAMALLLSLDGNRFQGPRLSNRPATRTLGLAAFGVAAAGLILLWSRRRA